MIERQAVVEMYRAMREMREEMVARVRQPNVVEVEAEAMAVQAGEAMIAMERIVAIMDREPGVIPEDMR